MAAQKKRTDIYNLKGLAAKVDIKNAPQKILMLFKGVDIYATNEDIKVVIAVLEQEHKDTVKMLKSMIKKPIPMHKVKLSEAQKKVIRRMRDNNANIMVSRYSDNRILSVLGDSVSDSIMDKLILHGIVSFLKETDIHNVYSLTPLGKTIEL